MTPRTRSNLVWLGIITFLLTLLLFVPKPADAQECQVRVSLTGVAANDFGFDDSPIPYGVSGEADCDVGNEFTLLGEVRYLTLQKTGGGDGEQYDYSYGAEWRIDDHWRIGVRRTEIRLEIDETPESAGFVKPRGRESIHAAYEWEEVARIEWGVALQEHSGVEDAESAFVALRFDFTHGSYNELGYPTSASNGKWYLPDGYQWKIIRSRFLVRPGGEQDFPLERRYGTAVDARLYWAF